MTVSFLKAGFKMNPEAVYFVPLGGCGSFGSNMALYGHQGKWIMVDCGMSFADDNMPGVDILLPDPAFAASLGEDLLGIIITHAHEDHIGALQHLWPRLKTPLYATKFAIERIRQHFSETPWGGQAKLFEVPARGRIDLGPFAIGMIKMAHSIPEARALAIKAGKAGVVLHTGDWKLDPDPVEGDKTDEEGLRYLGEEGVLAVVGDSTNAMVPGFSGSERDVQKNLTEVFSEFRTAVVISCFSTNVARLHSIYKAAEANGRQVCLVGRSLWNVDDAARKSGYLKDIPPFLDDEEAGLLPAENVVYICTGSQGEPRAVLSRLSNGDHPALALAAEDVVILSSRAIPGNERAIGRIKNRMIAMGVNVITDGDAPIHVSGHPCRDELRQFYGWVKPKIVLPVHGEHMQQEKHAELAKDCVGAQTLIPENGQVIEISAAGAVLFGKVESGVLAIEGKRIVAVDHEAILTRRRIMWNGSAVVTVVVNGEGLIIGRPQVTAMGLLDESSDLDAGHLDDAIREIEKKVRNASRDEKGDDHVLSEIIRIAARKYFQEKFDRKPQTRVHLVRV